MGFRRAKDEDSPLGRLFKGLQKGVEGFGRNLVRFVNDENLVSVAGGAKADVLTQFAHLIDASIGSGVNFDDVNRVSLQCFEAGRAFAAGVGGRPIDAIETARHNACDSRLARATLPGKDITMCDATLCDRIVERGFDMFLTDQFVEIAGPIFAGDDLIGHMCGMRISQTPGNPRHTS